MSALVREKRSAASATSRDMVLATTRLAKQVERLAAQIERLAKTIGMEPVPLEPGFDGSTTDALPSIEDEWLR